MENKNVIQPEGKCCFMNEHLLLEIDTVIPFVVGAKGYSLWHK